ncbi:MAG: VWA domain-containing protein [Bacteroidetes bacterium]|nr:VWA domain-containing protein [Bacteroidota bacterium]MDA1120408.1 VWA domain-containing protein [Bacteroidota bacterium]
MTWFQTISSTEAFFIALFIVLYSLYIFRVIKIAKTINTSYRRIFYKVLLRSVYFSLLIVALLGPSFGETSREVKAIGKDIFIAVDLSESMNSFDIQPSRLEKLKFELKNLVDAFNSDRIGIIMFSNEAFVQCPLTYDQSALNLFIETLNTELVPNSGTDFGPPLKTALAKLDDGESLTQQKSKIILLISDGEDFGEETNGIAKEVEEAGIKLFTLGIGTERGSKIMTRRGFKKDRQGEEIISKLNSTSLRQVAATTGGQYFEINDSRNDVSRLINTIKSIEGELRDSIKMDVSANKYYYFLSLALFLMIIDFMANIKTIRI